MPEHPPTEEAFQILAEFARDTIKLVMRAEMLAHRFAPECREHGELIDAMKHLAQAQACFFAKALLAATDLGLGSDHVLMKTLGVVVTADGIVTDAPPSPAG